METPEEVMEGHRRLERNEGGEFEITGLGRTEQCIPPSRPVERAMLPLTITDDQQADLLQGHLGAVRDTLLSHS